MVQPKPQATRERLIAAAETLFAERGVTGASLRDITSRAGANLAAVNYHFGSKEGLLRAVLETRLGPVNARRLELLDALEARTDLSVETLLDAFIRPAVDPAMRPSESFIQLMARIHHADDPVTAEVLGDVFGPVAARYLTALAKLLPTLPRDLVFQRMQFVIGAMIHSLFTKCEHKCQILTPPIQRLDDEAYLAEFVAFCAAGLRHQPEPQDD
jgi:AcrR family transcriptional regulator